MTYIVTCTVYTFNANWIVDSINQYPEAEGVNLYSKVVERRPLVIQICLEMYVEDNG